MELRWSTMRSGIIRDVSKHGKVVRLFGLYKSAAGGYGDSPIWEFMRGK